MRRTSACSRYSAISSQHAAESRAPAVVATTVLIGCGRHIESRAAFHSGVRRFLDTRRTSPIALFNEPIWMIDPPVPCCTMAFATERDSSYGTRRSMVDIRSQD